MAIHTFAAYQTRIYQFIFGLVVVFLGVVAVRNSMSGSSTPILNAVGTIALLSTVFLLDKRYWLFFWISAFLPKIPSSPFNGQEIGIIFITAIHFVRSALHLEPFAVPSRHIVFHVVVFAWIFMVFMLNPAGFFILGSTAMGGRFYFAVVLGLMALMTFSALEFDENDAKWLLWSIIATTTWSLIKSIYGGAASELQVSADESGGPGSRYYLLRALTFYTIIFACYPLGDILKSFRLSAIVFALAGATVMSGKRRAFGSLFLIPILRMVLTGRDKALTMLCGILSIFVMAFAIAGDGAFYDLPKSVTRSLSVFVPKYSIDSHVGILNDYFRQQMRKEARAVIAESPFLGRKGFAMDTEQAVWRYANSAMGDAFSGHVAAGAWHSAWYAYAADFGIPCLFFFVGIVVCEIRYMWNAVHLVCRSGYLQICILYFTMLLFLEIAFAYTSGHSAFTYRGHCVQFGIITALVRGYKRTYGGVLP